MGLPVGLPTPHQLPTLISIEFCPDAFKVTSCLLGLTRVDVVSGCSAVRAGPQATAASRAVLSRRVRPSLLVLDEIASVPVSLQTVKPAADRANPRIGVGALAFSPDNYFLATRNGQCSGPTPRPVSPGARHTNCSPPVAPPAFCRAGCSAHRSFQGMGPHQPLCPVPPASLFTPSCLGSRPYYSRARPLPIKRVFTFLKGLKNPKTCPCG